MGLVRRILVFTLVITLLLTGIPLPAHAAAGEEAPPLTFNGRPLSDLLHGPATDAAFPLPALLQQDDGQISGVLLAADGQPLADRRVELSRPRSEGEGRLVATTDANGAFSFTGLGPGRYEVLYVFLSEVRARSGAVGLAVGAMQVNEVTVALSANGGGRRWIGRHPALAGALIGAGSGFAAVYAILATSGYHEDRAWAVPFGLFFGAPIGAVVGAATGLVVSRIKR